MRTPLVTALVSIAASLAGRTLFAQSWAPPESLTNNVGIFDQQPSLDIGPAPNLGGEAAHIGYTRVDNKEIYYALKEFN